MIDVSQGDSVLITTKENESVLIDTGGVYNYNQIETKTIVYLKSLGIKKIDYLILTHGDYDHMGDANKLVSNFRVDNVIFNVGTYNDLEKKLIKTLDNKNIKYSKNIDSLCLKKHKLYFLNTGIYENENDNSSVIYFKFNGNKFLFMGDAGVERENDILNTYNIENIDFLKIGHHGSNSSSSSAFIYVINPKNSLISVGENNNFGHPSEVVIKNLKNSKIYRTDLDGSVELNINKNSYKIRIGNS